MTQIILSLLLAVSSMLVQMQTTPNISEVQRQQVLQTALQVLTVAQNYENSLPAATSTDEIASTSPIVVVPDLTITPTVTLQTPQYQQNQPNQSYNPALGQTYAVIPDPSCTITGTLMPNPNGATDKVLFDWDVQNGSPIALNALTASDRSNLSLSCGTNCETTITAPTTHGIGQWDQTYAQVTASTTTFTLNVEGNGKTASCSTTVLDPNGY